MLISEGYREQNRALHKSRPDYGTTARHHVEQVRSLAQSLGARTILDYGCGKALLSERIKGVVNYDPCIPEYSERPSFDYGRSRADLLVSIDVLEHIEPDCLDDVLSDMAGLMKIGYLTIAQFPAKKVLPDGRNAHLIVEDYRWWLPKLWEYFDIMSFMDAASFVVLVRPTHA